MASHDSHRLSPSQQFAQALDRRSAASGLALGILLRDYADVLAPVTGAPGFSIDQEARELLFGKVVGRPVEPVFGAYQELTDRLGPGPQTMFIAFGITERAPIAGRFDEEDVFAAVGLESKPLPGLDPSESVHRYANSDAPTGEDRLGISPLVEGLRALLDDPRTELPLSIGLTAPWGGGKSSLMFQLRRALAEPVVGRHRTWIPIRFDAWKFERRERIWAGLSRAIYEQSQRHDVEIPADRFQVQA